MDKKKVIGIVVFIVLGLVIFTFANPAPSTLDPVDEPGQEDKQPDKDKQQEEDKEDEKDDSETVGNIEDDEEKDESVVDYYQLALEAVIKAEGSLVQDDIDAAKDLINNVNEDLKEDLVNRVENVQNVVDYNKLLTELENKVNSSTNKDELNSARDYNTTNELANKLASLNDDANKEKLLNRYNVLLPKLNDTTAPVVSGVLNDSYVNDLVSLTISDDASFIATLNDENYITGAEIKEDGVYTLVVVDSSFNDTVVTFTIDTTKPTFNYTNGKIVKEGTLVFDDANFDYIKLYNHITKETEIIYANEFVFDGNINVDNLRYDITGCDKAGNCTSTFNLYHDTTEPVVSGTAKIGSKEVEFINGGTYKKVTLNITDGSLKEVILLNNNEVLKTFKDNFNSSIKMEFEQTFIEDGNYKIKAIDRAGNYEIIEFTIDNQKPIVNGIKDGEYYQSVVITVDDTSKLGSMHFKRNGKKYNYELGTELKEDGNYSFYITDVAGNKSEVINFVIDNNPADYNAVNFNVVSGYNDHNGTYFYATFGDVIYAHIRTNEILRENPTFTLTIGNEKIVLSGDKVNFKDEEKEEYTYLYSINYELPQEERFENLQNVEVKLEISNVVDKAGNVTLDKKTQQNIINITNSNKVFIDTTAPEKSGLVILGGNYNVEDKTRYANEDTNIYVYAIFNEKLGTVPTVKIDGKEYVMDTLFENNGTYRYYSREVKAENLDEGLVEFEVYGYKDAVGNKGRVLSNIDITEPSQSKVIVDTIAPTISISGTEGLNKNEYRIESGTPISLEDMLATATDASFGGEIKIEPKKVDFLAPGSVIEDNIYNYDYKANGFDTRKVGRYDIYYQVTDKAGNVSEEKLMMLVMTDTTAPVVTINGENDIYVEFGSEYNELGATMTDNVDATITNLQPTKINLYDLNGKFIKDVTKTGVNTNVEGKYLLYYDYEDGAGNSSKTDNGYTPYQAKRWVIVQDTKAPEITGVASNTTYFGSIDYNMSDDNGIKYIYYDFTHNYQSCEELINAYNNKVGGVGREDVKGLVNYAGNYPIPAGYAFKGVSYCAVDNGYYENKTFMNNISVYADTSADTILKAISENNGTIILPKNQNIILNQDLVINANTTIVGNGATVSGKVIIAGDNVVVKDIKLTDNLVVTGSNAVLDGVTMLNVNSAGTGKGNGYQVIKVNTNGNFTMKNSVIDNTYSKGSFYNAINISAKGKVEIENNKFINIENVYNIIEFSQSTPTATGTIIKGNEFTGMSKNNVISMFLFEDGNVITIEDNYFDFSGNALRISNYSNAKNVVINVNNNKYNDTLDGEYAGFMFFQEVKNESFAGITINVTNLIGPDDVKITSTTTGKHSFNYYYSDHNSLTKEDYATINFLD